MKWDIIKKAFRLTLTINLTTTKLIAWAMFFFTWTTLKIIPLDQRVFYVSTTFAVIFALYTGKNIQEYLKSKDDK